MVTCRKKTQAFLCEDDNQEICTKILFFPVILINTGKKQQKKEPKVVHFVIVLPNELLT